MTKNLHTYVYFEIGRTWNVEGKIGRVRVWSSVQAFAFCQIRKQKLCLFDHSVLDNSITPL